MNSTPKRPATRSKELGLTNENEGVIVTAVDEGGAGAEAGIAKGDVIIEVNRRTVNSVESVQAALDGAAGRPILLLINRRGQTVYLTVRQR